MAPKKIAVFCIFPHRTSFEYALCALKFAGFRSTDISILLQTDSRPEDPEDLGTEGNTRGMDVAGAHVGSEPATGTTLGWLAEPRSINIQGDGSFLISGPLVEALTGFEVGEREAGLTETLLGLGLSGENVNQYRGAIKKGGILFSVNCRYPSWAGKAKNLLGSTGAENICATRKTATG